MNNLSSIKSVSLTNYRNFKSAKLDLGNRSTIIIGKNGMGKTNLLIAIKQIFTILLSMRKDIPRYDLFDYNSLITTDFIHSDSDYEADDYQYPVSIGVYLQLFEEEVRYLDLSKYSSASQVSLSDFSAWKQLLVKLTSLNRVPLFAFYSESCAFALQTVDPRVIALQDLNKKNLPNIPFSKFDDAFISPEWWKNYYLMCWKNFIWSMVQEDGDFCRVIEQALVDFSKPLNSNNKNSELAIEKFIIEARGQEDRLVIQYQDGRSIPFDWLSNGHKRIFSIVLALASRGYLLQKTTNPFGVVLIDDIDLHLHPRLAQEIVQRLKRSFSNVQFVFTTHSPLVVADYKTDEDNLLYKIVEVDKGLEFKMLNSVYGLDYLTVLRGVMETPERDSYLQNLAGAYRYWKQIGDTGRLRRLEGLIKQYVGEGSEFYKNLTK